MENTKQILLAGVKSGMIAGVIGAILFGIYVEVVLLILSRSIATLYFITPLLVIGIPIGLVAGTLLGLLISYVVSKNSNVVQYVKILAVFTGCFAGSIYPLCLIYLAILFQESVNQEEIQEAILGLIGGLLSGGIAGLFGSKLFLRSLNALGF